MTPGSAATCASSRALAGGRHNPRRGNPSPRQLVVLPVDAVDAADGSFSAEGGVGAAVPPSERRARCHRSCCKNCSCDSKAVPAFVVQHQLDLSMDDMSVNMHRAFARRNCSAFLHRTRTNAALHTASRSTSVATRRRTTTCSPRLVGEVGNPLATHDRGFASASPRIYAKHTPCSAASRRASVSGKTSKGSLLTRDSRTAPFAVLYDAAIGFRVRNATYRATDEDELTEQVAGRDLRQIADAGFLVPVGEKRGRFYVASPQLRALRQDIITSRDPRDDSDPFTSWAVGAPAPTLPEPQPSLSQTAAQE